MPTVGVAVRRVKKLTRTQTRFNRLIKQIDGQRLAIADWKMFQGVYQRRLVGDYEPLAARLRGKRIALVERFDQIMDGGALGQRHRAKLRDILDGLLTELITEAADPALVALYDKYADVSYAEEQQQRAEVMRAVASQAFGIDIDGYEGGDSPEELAEWLDDRVRAARDERPPEAPVRPKSARAREREASQAAVAAGGTRALREIFRKLASALHPDRERDPAERARKTELMKELNQAYAARDLLGLLELQIRIEQIDSSTLTSLDEDQLRHYVHVLEEGAKRLQEQLDALVRPFALSVGSVPASSFTPELVERTLEADIRELKDALRGISAAGVSRRGEYLKM